MRRVTVVWLLLCALGCGASTTVVGTWRDPAYATRDVKRVLVIGLTPRAESQQKFEEAMAARLQRAGIEPFKGYDVLPRGQLADEGTVTAAVKKLGIDMVLVTKLVAVRTEAEFVPTAPTPGIYGMYPYYSYSYTTVYATGYVTQVQAVYLETSAFDVPAQKQVWSGLTRTFDYSSIDSIITSAAKRITNALLDQGIF